MKDFADNNFKFDENGRKLSKPVENTVGKGEIACYEQFLLFQPCFQKTRFPGASKGVIMWEWANSLPCNRIFDSSIVRAHIQEQLDMVRIHMVQNMRFVFEMVENIVGKVENAA